MVTGVLFAAHGAQKLLGMFGGQQVPLTSQFGLAGVIELVGGLMIAAGVFSSLVAFVASGEMAFAYFQAHAPRALLPVQNGGELSVLYLLPLSYIAARGNGIWSVQGGKRG